MFIYPCDLRPFNLAYLRISLSAGLFSLLFFVRCAKELGTLPGEHNMLTHLPRYADSPDINFLKQIPFL